MKRELKFRGINPYTNEFEYWWPHCDAKSLDPNDFWGVCTNFEQYTGLKDSTKWEDTTYQERKDWIDSGKNPSEWAGREIYEGDVVEISESLMTEIKKWKAEVIWLTNGWALTDKRCCEICESGRSGICDLTQFLNVTEIIGNIHENPELLK